MTNDNTTLIDDTEHGRIFTPTSPDSQASEADLDTLINELDKSDDL